MKIFLILIFIFPDIAFGQFGFKGGVALSGYQPSQNISTEYTHDYRPFLGYEVEWIQNDEGSPDVGLQAGIFYTQTISKYFAIQPEVNYTQRGIHFYKTELYNISYNLNVDYIEIPVLLKYIMPLDWTVVPSLLAGPYFSFTLGANRTLDFGEESNTQSVSGIKNFDYGLVFALVFELADFPASPMLELRFNLGLANTMQQSKEYISLYKDPGTVKLYALSLLTGFRI
jgi:hypothetical protein